MPASDSPAVLVARFLKANHYQETFEAFIKEAGLSEDDCNTQSGDWTIEKILEEKKQFDSSLAFDKHGDNIQHGWTTPAPSAPFSPNTSVNSASNILCVTGPDNGNRILITAADKSISQTTRQAPFHEIKVHRGISDSPVLSVWSLSDQLCLFTSMSGQLMLYDIASESAVGRRKDHQKYAVHVISTTDLESLSTRFIATAGWDQKIHLYHVHIVLPPVENTDSGELVGEGSNMIGKPIHTIDTQTVPESMIFVRHPDNDDLYLIFSRRDSTFLYYYHIRTIEDKIVVEEAGRQNLAPHSNAWVAFSPSCLALSPNDKTLVAVATSQVPHMKLLMVRLLFPGSLGATPQNVPRTQAAMARADLAVQDREERALMLHVSTMAPQTPYSNPQVVWRPDGSGLWVNGDDGAIRGIEVKTGKVVATLQAHEPGTKVRTIWAGNQSEQNGGSELLVSGGFDKKVFMWTIPEDLQTTDA